MKTPFEIIINNETIIDLKHRLASTRWPVTVSKNDWSDGTDISYLRDFCDYWEKEFSWSTQQAYLNTFNHYKSKINGFELHYIHEKGKGKNSVPLLLTHGYPDSFVRFLKIIPLLTAVDENGLSFDVIVPSIPGYGFSERPREKGMNPEKIAALFSNLMVQELGYEKFGAHGGDWGSSITEQVALQIPQHLIGIHFTDIPYKHIFEIAPDELTKAEKKYIEAGKKWQMLEGAYAMIQGTKPQSLAYGVNDSPAGLAAWLIEKFRSWSDCHGKIETRFTKDELITNLMIYWVTQTTGSAFRIYYESMNTPPKKDRIKPTVPAGFAIFPKDMVPAPKEFAERMFTVQRFKEMPEGGHFAAMETPELLAGELRQFFGDLLNIGSTKKDTADLSLFP